MDIGNRIHELRVRLGYSTRELGDKVGVSHVTISRWENGKVQNLFVGNIEALAKALYVSPLYLLGFDNANNDVAIQRICNKVKTLSTDQLEKLDQMIDVMFKK